MNYEDFIIPPSKIKAQQWHFAKQFKEDLPENGIALLFVSDFRGAGKGAEIFNFSDIRKNLYQLSGLDFEVPMYDFGDLISGKTLQDTHYALQEVVSACLYKNTIPIIVGGSNDLAYSLFYALNFHQKNNNFTQISNVVSLSNEGEEINEQNYLSRIFSTKNFSIKNYHLLGYQKHLNELDRIKLIKEVDFDVVRLAEMMNDTHNIEPYFRRANLVTVNCDAVESFGEPFSIHPQVNGLNRREICGYMKEIGLSEDLKAVGIFNYNFEAENLLNHQLLSQMIWYLVEGINIQQSHPKDRQFETFWLMIDEQEYAFKRDTFSGLWYFGNDENLDHCLPCALEDYEMAKRGKLNYRLLNFVK